MVKWCLYLHHKSSSSYELLRKSGIICLPSGRTLRDYRHFAPVVTGFSSTTDKQLQDLAKQSASPDLSKYLITLIDEMYIKEGLVIDKSSGALTGFLDMGEINNHFMKYETLTAEMSTGKTHRPLA